MFLLHTASMRLEQDVVCPASFSVDTDPSVGLNGQLAHRRQFEQLERVSTRFWTVRPGVWCFVGNGLSNQTFVEGPDGIIAIDTGECIEEMNAALKMLREHTDRPIAAVIYTHFHYVAGTAAIDSDAHIENYDIWGHERITANRNRMASETGVVLRRGLVHQFGLALPTDGPDAVVSAGLGPWYRNPAHAPFTEGFRAPTRTLAGPTVATIAGLTVELTPAPSDCDDSITIHFPELGVVVENIVWPALFNVYAIRGEEYRDPRVLLTGLDHIAALGAEHLVGAHGPPVSGGSAVSEAVTLSRDAIQFLWDQTVRGLNRDLSAGELIEFVQLPPCFESSYFSQQLYGLAEHHVRQIHTGIRGWFDGYEADLFPLPTAQRAQRMIDGFGGRDTVRRQAATALEASDLRWALELATWLVRSVASAEDFAVAEPQDRALLGQVLRSIAQHTTSANVRNWCLTRAREVEGLVDLSRHRRQRFFAAEVLAADPAVFVHVLRVLLVPERATDTDVHVGWVFDEGSTAGLHVRNCVAVPTNGAGADHIIHLAHSTWAQLLASKTTLSDALASAAVRIVGDPHVVSELLSCFDHPAFDLRAS
jgi:alkyl sulfatase BDS1-like metallo-beta-lactamase superfamily hydrolase